MRRLVRRLDVSSCISIDVDSDSTENVSDQGELKTKKNNGRKTSTSTDAGFYDGSGSDRNDGSSSDSGRKSADGSLSGYASNSGSEANSSDSGVATPPLKSSQTALHTEGTVQDSKKQVRSILKSSQHITFHI